jgi:hypothetical protein
VRLLSATKILVSAWENAKLNDRSMSAHFIKMRVNGSFSLKITKNPFKNKMRVILNTIIVNDK